MVAKGVYINICLPLSMLLICFMLLYQLLMLYNVERSVEGDFMSLAYSWFQTVLIEFYIKN
jgi:hypothetical protein